MTITLPVAEQLQLEADAEALRRIAKFIRCNGDAGLLEAAREVRKRLTAQPGAIGDPWSYCVSVYNANAARAAALYPLVFLLENGLRARVMRRSPNSFIRRSGFSQSGRICPRKSRSRSSPARNTRRPRTETRESRTPSRTSIMASSSANSCRFGACTRSLRPITAHTCE